jgi:hypothetical protein
LIQVEIRSSISLINLISQPQHRAVRGNAQCEEILSMRSKFKSVKFADLRETRKAMPTMPSLSLGSRQMPARRASGARESGKNDPAAVRYRPRCKKAPATPAGALQTVFTEILLIDRNNVGQKTCNLSILLFCEGIPS